MATIPRPMEWHGSAHSSPCSARAAPVTRMTAARCLIRLVATPPGLGGLGAESAARPHRAHVERYGNPVDLSGHSAGQGFAGRLVEWARAILGRELEIVGKAPDRRGFQVQPKRWAVERTFSWITAHRRLARDYEQHTARSETMIRWAIGGATSPSFEPLTPPCPAWPEVAQSSQFVAVQEADDLAEGGLGHQHVRLLADAGAVLAFGDGQEGLPRDVAGPRPT